MSVPRFTYMQSEGLESTFPYRRVMGLRDLIHEQHRAHGELLLLLIHPLPNSPGTLIWMAVWSHWSQKPSVPPGSHLLMQEGQSLPSPLLGGSSVALPTSCGASGQWSPLQAGTLRLPPHGESPWGPLWLAAFP